MGEVKGYSLLLFKQCYAKFPLKAWNQVSQGETWIRAMCCRTVSSKPTSRCLHQNSCDLGLLINVLTAPFCTA